MRGAVSVAMALVLASAARDGCTPIPQPNGRIKTAGNQFTIDGAPVRFIGYADYGLFYDDKTDVPAWMKKLGDNHINYMRQWVLPVPESFGVAMQPVPFTVVNGKRRYDFSRLNPAFWDRVDLVLDEAAKRNIVVQVSVYDHFTMKPANFAGNPLNTANGGFVPASQFGAFPGFFTDATVIEATRVYTAMVLGRLAKHWNVILEPMNEPAAERTTPDAVSQWHSRFNDWARGTGGKPGATPDLLLVPNVVLPDCDNDLIADRCEDLDHDGQPDDCQATHSCPAACNGQDWAREHMFYPSFADTRNNAFSVHGNEWACQNHCDARGVRDSVALLTGYFGGLPVIIDTDGTGNKSCGRDNPFLQVAVPAACLARAAGFDHRDDEPYTPNGTVDEEAMRRLATFSCTPGNSRPTPAFTAPADGAQLPRGQVQVKGTTSDDEYVVGVFLQAVRDPLNGPVVASATARSTDQFRNWSGTLDLTRADPGEISLSVFAIDSSGLGQSYFRKIVLR